MRGGQDFVIGFRTNYYDAFYPCLFCGDDGHEQGGEQGEAAAGNVAADGVDGADELGDFHTRLDFEGPRLRQLFLRDTADVAGSMSDGVAKFPSNSCCCGLEFLRREPQTIRL